LRDRVLEEERELWRGSMVFACARRLCGPPDVLRLAFAAPPCGWRDAAHGRRRARREARRCADARGLAQASDPRNSNRNGARRNARQSSGQAVREMLLAERHGARSPHLG
jgi:hypothetical protein